LILEFKGEHRWLSNFWEQPGIAIPAFGIRVPTVEHGYQAAKCRNESERRMILQARTPGTAKRLGQDVELRADWEDVKEAVMHTLLRRKFAHVGLMAELLHAGDQLLMEGNKHRDDYWGAIPAKMDRILRTPANRIVYPAQGWVGLNRLGELLMQVRSELLVLRGL